MTKIRRANNLPPTQGEGPTFEEAIMNALDNRRRTGITDNGEVDVVRHSVRRAGDPSRLWHTVDTVRRL